MFSPIQTASMNQSSAGAAVAQPSCVKTVTLDGVSTDFNINVSGDSHCEDILFPENGINLMQEHIDATAFEQACLQLPAEQLQVVRRWTMTEAEHHERFSDGTLNLNRQRISGIHYDLNAALDAGTPLTPEQHEACLNLSAALSQLPSVRGEYLGIEVHPDSDDMPWGNRINVGDTVTGFPCFMSVSETENHAQDIISEQGSLEPEEGYREGIVIYKIENATTAVPLLRGILSLADEHEALFARDACFEVRGIALASPATAGMPVRVGVLLREVPHTGQPLRNLSSGEQVQITAL